MTEELRQKKDFNGYIVKCCGKDTCNINGMKVIETRRWLKCKNPDSTLYEVKLENGRLYQLYELEMVKE